jgi:hypothetical protein
MLAPAYDIVCTTAWLPHDQPALPMNGLREWPDADDLRDFGKTCCHLDDETITRVFDDTLAALRSSDGLLDDLQAKYPDVVELQHLREVVERSADMLSADILREASAKSAALHLEQAFHHGMIPSPPSGGDVTGTVRTLVKDANMNVYALVVLQTTEAADGKAFAVPVSDADLYLLTVGESAIFQAVDGAKHCAVVCPPETAVSAQDAESAPGKSPGAMP